METLKVIFFISIGWIFGTQFSGPDQNPTMKKFENEAGAQASTSSQQRPQYLKYPNRTANP